MEREPIDYVDPLLDTGKPYVRWVFSASACCPFGLVRLSPDTDRVGTWGAGYRYFSEKINCFSHIHSFQLSGLPVMPVSTLPSEAPVLPEEWGSRFSHAGETVQPGYHKVYLDDHQVEAELTATPRVGFHRYAFPADGQPTLLFYLGADLGPSNMTDTYAATVGDREIEGYVENSPTKRRPKPCRIYFVVKFASPYNQFQGWQKDTFLTPGANVTGQDTGFLVTWKNLPDNVVSMKVGMSFVSIEQARLNLAAEAADLDFDAARNQTQKQWNTLLQRIEVEGGTPQEQTKFYTDLWRTLMGGYMTNDVDGSYVDRTGDVPVVRKIPPDHRGAPSYRRLEGDIFWGAHWSLSVLWQLIYPEFAHDWCNTLVEMYKEGGLIPRGPSGGNYTFVMIASHSTAFLTGAYMKGIRSFDVESAYRGMRKNALPGGLMSKAGYEQNTCTGGGIEYYMSQGFIPANRKIKGPFHVDGAAQTLEYSFDDWCLAQMAKALGYEDDHTLFSQRAQNYRNLYDASIGFMRPKNQDGNWLEPFDPYASEDWCEGNGWHYTWYVPHDIPGLVELMGREQCINKLDQAFRNSAKSDFYTPKHIQKSRQTIPYLTEINYGNEPGRYAAHVFNHAGAPWLSQKWARRVWRQTFAKTQPDGYCEDDDNGLAAGTSVLLALGLFDLQGGAALNPGYEITPPVFEKIILHLEETEYGSEPFVIETVNNDKGNDYIERAVLNGEKLESPWFAHEKYIKGGRLYLKLSDKANHNWKAVGENEA